MKRLKEIHFDFENMDEAILQAEHIQTMEMSGLSKTVVLALGNVILENQKTEKVVLVLANEANQKQGTFFLFERLKEYQDIKSLMFVYDDQTMELFTMNWHDEEQENNLFQSVCTTGEGLVVLIHPNKTAFDYIEMKQFEKVAE